MKDKMLIAFIGILIVVLYVLMEVLAEMKSYP